MILKPLASLKLAVFLILGLAASLATATVLESLYDTPTARYFVYQSNWFYGLLGLLAVCLISVMVDRWPWKRKHVPFLLAHLGIVTLLLGSWITERFGLDGSMRITEGESSNAVELERPVLVLSEGEKVFNLPIPWVPPGVPFHPFAVRDRGIPYDLTVDGFMSHADVDFSFVPRGKGAPDPMDASTSARDGRLPALKLKLVGGPMRIAQDFWLWRGDPGFSGIQAGPAWLELRESGEKAVTPPPSPDSGRAGPRLSFIVERDGSLSYEAESSDHERVTGRFGPGQIDGQVIEPKWRGGVTIQLVKWVPDAVMDTHFHLSRTQYGEFAPPSAVHVAAGDPKRVAGGARMWLGVGSRAILHSGGHEVEIGYYRQRVVLPFSIRLDRFTVDTYEGGQKPSAYSSRVTVFGGGGGATPAPASGQAAPPEFSRLISMNDPMEYAGYTFYQASYEDALPRPVTSILSVNRDPGRRLKYTGSLLIVFGSIWLFATKYAWRRRRVA